MAFLIKHLIYCYASQYFYYEPNAGLAQICSRLLAPDCVCCDSITVYECSITQSQIGGNYDFAVWRVVDINNYCEIRFNYSQFEINKFNVVQVWCNTESQILIQNGTIQAIRNENECYTTQLTIIHTCPRPFLYQNELQSIQYRVGFFGEILIDAVTFMISSYSKCYKPNNTVSGSTELVCYWLL